MCLKPTYNCDQSKDNFFEKGELRNHIMATHNNYKPYRNFFTEGGCNYNDACHFSHTQVGLNMQRCYKCGNKFENVNQNHKRCT